MLSLLSWRMFSSKLFVSLAASASFWAELFPRATGVLLVSLVMFSSNYQPQAWTHAPRWAPLMFPFPGLVNTSMNNASRQPNRQQVDVLSNGSQPSNQKAWSYGSQPQQNEAKQTAMNQQYFQLEFSKTLHQSILNAEMMISIHFIHVKYSLAACQLFKPFQWTHPLIVLRVDDCFDQDSSYLTA